LPFVERTIAAIVNERTRKMDSVSTESSVPDVFVGRTAELEALSRRVESATSGFGSVVLIAGDPGIGKTRLAEEAARYARGRGIRVLWGSCWEGEGAPAFWPWVQVMRSFAAAATSDSWTLALGRGAGDIARVIPELREYMPGLDVGSDSADSDQARFRFFDSFASFLKRLAAAQPLMVVLDDLHCTDGGSLLLLQFLSGTVGDSAIFILGTYRGMVVRPGSPILETVAAIERITNAKKLVLSGLSRPEARLLLRSIRGSEPSEGLMGMMMERTEGNPLFLRELTTLQVLGDVLERPYATDVGNTIPLTIREVIGKHIQSASPECAGLLAVASVVGREFDASLVLSAVDKQPTEFGKLLDEAVRDNIIEYIRTMHYRFRHSLVREIIYDSLPTMVRAQIHQAIVVAVERSNNMDRDSTQSMLAHHACMSLPYGSIEKALEYTVRAGNGARRRLAYEEAVVQYERALALGGSRISSETLCDLLLSLGEAQARAGLWVDSRRTFERAASEARLISSSSHFARAAVGFNGMIGSTNPMDQAAVSLLREALARLGGPESDLHVRVLRALTHSLYFGGAEREMDEYSSRAQQIANGLDDGELKRIALDARLIRLLRPANVREMITTATELLESAVDAGDREIAFRGHLARHVGFLELGDWVAATLELRRASALAEELRDPRCLWQVAVAASTRCLSAGDFTESLRLTESARAIGERVHDFSTTQNFLLQRFQQDRIRGTIEGWEGIGPAVLSQWPSIVACRLAYLLVLAARGQKHEVDKMISVLSDGRFRAIPHDAFFLWSMALLVEACAALHDVRWCATLYELLSPYRDHNVVVSWAVTFDGSVSHFLGLLSAIQGHYDQAAAEFEVALETNSKMDAEPLVARTQIQYAELLASRRRGRDKDHALQLLNEAATIAKRTGQVGYLARANELLNRFGTLGQRDIGAKHPAEHQSVGADVVASEMGPVDQPEYLFRREGDFWTIAFEGRLLRLRTNRGLAILSFLVRRPGVEVHVFDIISAVDGLPYTDEEKRRNSRGRRSGTAQAWMQGDVGPTIDARARAEYRRYLEELRSELAEAERFNDVGRTFKLRAEMERIAIELSRAYGRGGRPRTSPSVSERARINVRNNISNALALLKRFDLALWRHFDAAIRTGTYCSYRPEHPIQWAF